MPANYDAGSFDSCSADSGEVCLRFCFFVRYPNPRVANGGLWSLHVLPGAALNARRTPGSLTDCMHDSEHHRKRLPYSRHKHHNPQREPLIIQIPMVPVLTQHFRLSPRAVLSVLGVAVDLVAVVVPPHPPAAHPHLPLPRLLKMRAARPPRPFKVRNA